MKEVTEAMIFLSDLVDWVTFQGMIPEDVLVPKNDDNLSDGSLEDS